MTWRIGFLLAVVVALGGGLAGAATAVAAQIGDAVLSVSVVEGPSPAPGVVGDLYLAAADGSRSTWLGDQRTAADGSYDLVLEPGCYVLVLIAPEDRSFVEIDGRAVVDGRFAEALFCLDAGTQVNTRASLESRLGSAVTGTVTDPAAEPVAEIIADVFTDIGGGQRGQWLGSAVTGDDGTYRRPVDPGCYVVVLVSPEGTSFVSSGTRYREVPGCVDPGSELRIDGVVVGAGSDQATISGTVVDPGNQGVGGVVADVFRANADGGRGRWLGDEATDGSGRFSRPVEPGCYVVVLLAPSGQAFAPDGGVFRELAACLRAGDTVDFPAVTVRGGSCAAGPVNLDVNPNGFVRPSNIVTGSDGKIYFVGDDDTAATDLWFYDPATGEGGNLGIPATPTVLVAGDGVLYYRDRTIDFDRHIRRYDLSTGEAVTIGRVATQFFSGPILIDQWLMWQRNGPVVMYNVDTGETVERPEGGFRLQGGVAQGPDGRVYYRRQLDRAQVISWIDLDTGETDDLDLGPLWNTFVNQSLAFGPGGRLFFAGLPLGDEAPALLFSFDPATSDLRTYPEFETPIQLTTGRDGRLYFRATVEATAGIYGVDTNGEPLGDAVATEPPAFEIFDTDLDGRLFFAAVQDPVADTRLMAREIRVPLDTETVALDGATFVDQLHFSPDGTIYFSGFDGNENELFAYRPQCLG